MSAGIAIVMSSQASMPGSCKGRYRYVTVVEVCHWDANVGGPDWRPTSMRAKSVLRIIRRTGPHSVGKTERCAYAVALASANDLARAYNNAGDAATAEDLIGAGGSA